MTIQGFKGTIAELGMDAVEDIDDVIRLLRVLDRGLVNLSQIYEERGMTEASEGLKNSSKWLGMARAELRKIGRFLR